MTDKQIYIFLAFAAAAAILLIFLFFKKGKLEKKQLDYRQVFYMGITWLPLGIVLKVPALWILGLIFLAIGLMNRKKWKEPGPPTPKQKKQIVISTIIGLLLFITGLVVYFFFE